MDIDKKLIIGMIGLPARGKSYISRKLVRMLNWIGLKSKVFNIGVYRRQIVGVDCQSDFFDQDNKEGVKLRENCALLAITDLINFLKTEGNIGILDGTNTTRKRRRSIESFVDSNMNQKYKLIWIESICDLREIIENNIFKTKINSPDYKNWEDPEKAANDFRRRIEEYEKIYESLSLDNDGLDTSFIKIINQGEKMIMRNVRGYVESKIISYLTNLHTGDRPIYFLRHGESEANKHGFIGDDYCLTENGFIFSEMLVKFFEKESEAFNEKPIIFSSTLKPNIQTAEKLSFMNDILIEKILDELNAGLREGLNLKEMAEKYPNELKERNEDKLNYRYPRGESYLDVIHRIEPVIFEMERIKSPIIVIGSQGIMRCLYGYFADFAAELIPSLEIPLHCVIKFVPEAYGFYEVRYSFDVNSQTIEKNDKNFISLLDN